MMLIKSKKDIAPYVFVNRGQYFRMKTLKEVFMLFKAHGHNLDELEEGIISMEVNNHDCAHFGDFHCTFLYSEKMEDTKK